MILLSVRWIYSSLIWILTDKTEALHSKLHYFVSNQHDNKQDACCSAGCGGDDDSGRLQSVRRTAGPSIHRNTSLLFHLQNQSPPPLIDVWIIELSLGFSCFSCSLLQTLGIVLYFTLTPFTTKDILVCIYVNVLTDCCRGDGEIRSAAPGLIDRQPVQAN